MASEPSPQEMDELRFMGLVDMLASSALAALGKLADPSTGKAGPVQLEHARVMIDLIEMLERKTKGHLGDREKKMLEMQLTNLRLTFVDELNRAKANGTLDQDDDDDDDEDDDEDDESSGSESSAGGSSQPQDSGGFKDRRSGRS